MRGGKQKPAENRVVGDIACSEERNMCFHFFFVMLVGVGVQDCREATHHILHILIHVEDILFDDQLGDKRRRKFEILVVKKKKEKKTTTLSPSRMIF